MTDYWEISIPIKSTKTDENSNIQKQTEIDDDHEDFIYEEEETQPVKPDIEIDADIREYGAVLDESTLSKDKKDILNLSLTTNTSIHTLSEIIEDPEEQLLNSVIQEKSSSSSKKVMTQILERLATNSITQNNNVGISINVTEENQKSPERSPRPAYNEENAEENEIESPAKRIKLDKPETDKNITHNDTVDDKSSEELYNIEKIVKSRKNPKNKKQLQYLIKWEGWSASTNTWEPAEYIRKTVPALVKLFEQSKKNKAAAGGGNKNTRSQQKKKVQNKKSAL